MLKRLVLFVQPYLTLGKLRPEAFIPLPFIYNELTPFVPLSYIKREGETKGGGEFIVSSFMILLYHSQHRIFNQKLFDDINVIFWFLRRLCGILYL